MGRRRRKAGCGRRRRRACEWWRRREQATQSEDGEFCRPLVLPADAERRRGLKGPGPPGAVQRGVGPDPDQTKRGLGHGGFCSRSRGRETQRQEHFIIIIIILVILVHKRKPWLKDHRTVGQWRLLGSRYQEGRLGRRLPPALPRRASHGGWR